MYLCAGVTMWRNDDDNDDMMLTYQWGFRLALTARLVACMFVPTHAALLSVCASWLNAAAGTLHRASCTYLVHFVMFSCVFLLAFASSLADRRMGETFSGPLLRFFTSFHVLFFLLLLLIFVSQAQRLVFDQSSPNGILLFRECSKIAVAFGTRLLQVR